MARIQILRCFGKAYQEQVLAKLLESAVGAISSFVDSFVQLAGGGVSAEWDIMEIVSFFLANFGVFFYEQVFAEYFGWNRLTIWRLKRRAGIFRCCHMQFFAGKLWRIVYGVSLLQVAFPHIFRYAHFPFIAVLNLATLRREEPCTQGFAICKQGTNFFLRDCSACVSCVPALGVSSVQFHLRALAGSSTVGLKFFFLAVFQAV